MAPPSLSSFWVSQGTSSEGLTRGRLTPRRVTLRDSRGNVQAPCPCGLGLLESYTDIVGGRGSVVRQTLPLSPERYVLFTAHSLSLECIKRVTV